MSDYRSKPDMGKGRPARMEAQMWKRLKAWWQADLDLQRLRGLDDRLLADIGMERAEMKALVFGTGAQGLTPCLTARQQGGAAEHRHRPEIEGALAATGR
jgi:uncharacterized protein YjiS (DUF1127 family)